MNSFWYTQATLAVDPDEASEWLKVIEPVIAQVLPEYPPEVHNTRPIDGDRCMAATKALCG